jgi:hypothetical protein
MLKDSLLYIKCTVLDNSSLQSTFAFHPNNEPENVRVWTSLNKASHLKRLRQ